MSDGRQEGPGGRGGGSKQNAQVQKARGGGGALFELVHFVGAGGLFSPGGGATFPRLFRSFFRFFVAFLELILAINWAYRWHDHAPIGPL